MNVDRLKKQLIIDEAKKNFPYTDTVGKLTIGVGRNLTDRGLSEDEIDYLLQNDIQLVLKDLVNNLPWFIKLDSVRQEVLMNMCFNLGWPRLSLFKTTLSLIKQGLYKDASISMLTSLWAKQVGQRAVRLAKQMETGVSLLS